MNLRIVVLALLLLVAGGVQAQKKKKKKKGKEEVPVYPVPQNPQDSFSYAYGMLIYENFKKEGIILTPNMMAEGMRALVEEQTIFSDKEANELVRLVLEKANERKRAEEEKNRAMMDAKKDSVSQANIKLGNEFLQKNKQREGVQVTSSGLQYEIITQGNGQRPVASDKVKTHYKGTLLDGSTFDSSYDRGRPLEFELSRVIKGWTEGLQLMPVGSKYKFFIPPYLAYGPSGPPKIGPNATLIFEVELLDIVTPGK